MEFPLLCGEFCNKPNWIESKLEGKLELTINREKTKVLRIKPGNDELCFLGYSYRYEKDLKGRVNTI